MLKNPSHLFALDALIATYPDALVIQTHRPVETIMASMCSLAQHTAAGWSRRSSAANRRGRDGNLVARAGAIQYHTGQI